MRIPLLLVTLCATGAVAALSATAVAAFASPAASHSTTIRGLAPLNVPLNHRPAGFAAPFASQGDPGRNIVVVGVGGAITLGSTPNGIPRDDAFSAPGSGTAAIPHAKAPVGPTAPNLDIPAVAAAPHGVAPGAPVSGSIDEVGEDKAPKPAKEDKPAKDKKSADSAVTPSVSDPGGDPKSTKTVKVEKTDKQVKVEKTDKQVKDEKKDK